MKIIRVSNFNIETEAEYVVADNIKHEKQANIMCNALNVDVGPQSDDYFRVVPDDYVLWRGMADIVGD